MVYGQPVCDDGFNIDIAHVACKELGYFGAVSYIGDGVRSPYGSPSPDFAMDNVQCEGTEERLLDCTHSKVRKIFSSGLK